MLWKAVPRVVFCGFHSFSQASHTASWQAPASLDATHTADSLSCLVCLANTGCTRIASASRSACRKNAALSPAWNPSAAKAMW